MCPPDFDNNPTTDVLIDLDAYVSEITQNDKDAMKQKAPNNIFKIDEFSNFKIQVANGQLAEPIAAAILKFNIGDSTFA